MSTFIIIYICIGGVSALVLLSLCYWALDGRQSEVDDIAWVITSITLLAWPMVLVAIGVAFVGLMIAYLVRDVMSWH